MKRYRTSYPFWAALAILSAIAVPSFVLASLIG